MTQAINLANFANNLNTSGQVDPNALGSVVPLNKGGTNATDAAGARTSLDVPKRDGTNATGTWAINISGNAANVSDGAITEVKLSPGVAAANLGFNPIQQSGGTGQLGNKVFIGWSGLGCWLRSMQLIWVLLRWITALQGVAKALVVMATKSSPVV
jgi:hypothetical protein